MARPSKNTVDYFPHDCEHGKTMYIIDQNYKNDGYAFWFKLLERLGASAGHVIDTKTPEELEYLSAKTHIAIDKCTEILDLLARLGAIDSELWSTGVIWSQNFVDRLAVVYQKRHTEIPVKPNSRTENEPIALNTVEKTPQSKVKESKVKKEVCPKSFDSDSLSFRLAKILWEDISEKTPSAKAPDLNKWAIEFDRILRIDRRDADFIRITMIEARKDPFWQQNILSPDKLRKHLNAGKLQKFVPAEWRTNAQILEEVKKREGV